MSLIDYKMAGVDIEAGNEAVRRIKKAAEKTFSPRVLTGIGSFGAMYDLRDLLQTYQHPVLVQSIDGVGTKTMIAHMMQKYDTLGIDVVSATANDIIVLGAKPLTLLDYIASETLCPDIIEQIILGMAKACSDNDISLVGGETAEMPGTYRPGEQDVVAVITGVVEKDKAILGNNIAPGDVVLGLDSSGMHTNGYSLARKLFFERSPGKIDDWHDDLQCTLGEALLAPHLNYTRPILHFLNHGIDIKGMAHITGGGFLENIPRILPPGCAVNINKNSWDVPPLFSMMQRLGQLGEDDMFRTFNMGIGLIIIANEDMAERLKKQLTLFPEFRIQDIGCVVPADKKMVRLL